MSQGLQDFAGDLVERCAKLEMALAIAMKYMPHGERYAGPPMLDPEAARDVERVTAVMPMGAAGKIQRVIAAADPA